MLLPLLLLLVWDHLIFSQSFPFLLFTVLTDFLKFLGLTNENENKKKQTFLLIMCPSLFFSFQTFFLKELPMITIKAIYLY